MEQEEPQRAAVCSICGARNESFHLNYGAATCLGCRAFFRRVVQKAQTETLVCVAKSGFANGMCDVSYLVAEARKRRCGKCRFDRCLQVGMKPELVLDPGQKTIRFRKFINKQQKQAQKKEIRPEDVSDGTELKFPKKRKLSADGTAESLSPKNYRQILSSPYYASGSPSSSSSTSYWLAVNSEQHQHHFHNRVPTSFDDSPRFVELPQREKSADGIHRNTPEQDQALDLTNEVAEMSVESTTEAIQDIETTKAVTVIKEKVEAKTPSSPYYDDEEDDGGERRLPCVNYSTSDPRFRSRMLKYVSHLSHTWNAAIASIESEDDEDWLLPLIWLFLGESLAVSKEDLKHYLMRLAKIFRAFALQQPEFANLSSGDQRKLLCTHVPTFLQYILARFLHSESAAEQLRWITLKQKTDDIANSMNFEKMTLERFDMIFGLFEVTELKVKFRYEDNLEKMKNCDLQFDNNCVFVLMILFGNNCAVANGMFDSFKEIYDQVNDNRVLVDWCHDVLDTPLLEDMNDWHKSCAIMAQIFEDNIDWTHNLREEKQLVPFRQLFKREVVMKTSSEENFWITHQMDSMTRRLISVHVPDDTFELFLSYQYDGRFTPDKLKPFGEILEMRAMNAMNREKEFAALSPEKQADNIRTALPMALFAYIAQVETAGSVLKHMSIAMSPPDVEKLATFTRTSASKLRHITIRNVPPEIANKEVINELLDVSADIAKVTWNDLDAFKLLMLLMMSSGPDLKPVFKRYQKFWAEYSAKKNYSVSLNEIIEKVKIVGKLLPKMFKEPNHQS